MTIPLGNDATSASGTSPVLGYSLKLMRVILFLFEIVLILNTCTCYVSLTIVMKILLTYMFKSRIKLHPKMPSFSNTPSVFKLYVV